MASLLEELYKFKREFPIGLSGITGMGYILTGGISPLSRQQGLAIDQIEKVNGIWGNGDLFSIERPSKSTSENEKLYWRGLLGAAPFLGIVTSIELKTFPTSQIYIWKGILDQKNLADLIQDSETWSYNGSLQWEWADGINFYCLFADNKDQPISTIQFIESLRNKYGLGRVYKINGLINTPPFGERKAKYKKQLVYHSEVLGLLGSTWENKSERIIKKIRDAINSRPHPNCSISSQQLGGSTSRVKEHSTSFIHRDSIWKPWITASWEKGDLAGREKSLAWLKRTWEELEEYCPHIHMAQMHPHLPWHEKELKCAYGEWLTGLRRLKSECDPNGLMTPL